MLKCLWWWYAKAGHISAAALGCTVIVFTVFVTCSRRVQPSCSRWICSALRRNGSWQAWRGARAPATSRTTRCSLPACQRPRKISERKPWPEDLVFNNFTKNFIKDEKRHILMQSGSIIFGLSINLLGLLLFPHSSDGQGCNNLSLQSFCLKTDVSLGWWADKTTWG